ncbi:MAG: hypothetical protein JNL96_04115 [Planctomycetaceae bacterium]|nr:hypothetical protein [Planctomycetaceae bacterium]
MKSIEHIQLPLFGLSHDEQGTPAGVRASSRVFVPLFTSTERLNVFLERTALKLRPQQLSSWYQLWRFARQGASLCDDLPATKEHNCWFVVDPIELAGAECRPFPAAGFLEAVQSRLNVN